MKRLYHYPVMLLLTILAIITFIGFEATAFVRYVVFEPGIYSEAMIRGRVADIMYDELVDYFNGFSGPTGIPAEVFTAKLDKEALSDAAYQLTADSLTYLTDSSAAKPQPNFDFSEIEGYVDAYIEAYTDANGIEKDESYYKLIENTHKTIESQIMGQLDVTLFYSLSKTSYAEDIHRYAGFIEKGVYIFGVAFLFIVMLLVVVDRRHPRDLPYWFGTLFFSAGAIVLFPTMYLDKISYFDSFFMRTDNVYKTITGVCKVLMNRIINTQTAVMLLGIFLVIVTVVIHMIYLNYLKRKHERGYRHHHHHHHEED